jgi:hypothetical protein
MSETTRMNPPDHSVAYPLNHVISTMPTEKEAIAAFDTLIANGFPEAEVTLISGPELADRIGSWTVSGRAPERPLPARDEYVQALRDGHVNVLVLAPTEELKQRTAEILRQHGGHFINFFGRSEVERLG